jgi:MoxR-like ATPase
MSDDNEAPPAWHLYVGDHTPHDRIKLLPLPPPWRPFRTEEVDHERRIPAPSELPTAMVRRAETFRSTPAIRDMVNAALYLRRPLLVTGTPGSGKSSLIDAVAYELKLGVPLRWNVTSRSTLRDGEYRYDAVGRLQDQQHRASVRAARSKGGAADNAETEQAPVPIAPYLRLGPLGTALLPTDRPRALLVDEIDKADMDLPNDLLNVLEEGEFEIPELARLGADQQVVRVRTHGSDSDDAYPVRGGQVRMKQFPFVVFTSNGERSFPPAFLRRCLQLEMPDPTQDDAELALIVDAHLSQYLDEAGRADATQRIKDFVERAKKGKGSLATDQLLNAVFLVSGQIGVPHEDRNELVRRITQALA